MMQSPMLAKNFDPNTLTFPRFASVKLDGWRAVVVNGVVCTRSGKAIANRYVQEIFGRYELNGLDGELIVGPPNLNSTYNTTQTALKRADGEPDVHFYVYDHFEMPSAKYEDRIGAATHQVINFADANSRTDITILEQTLINDMSELDSFEEITLENGYEGIMLRPAASWQPDKYKYGRSTVNEAFLLKVKRFSHDEALIIGFIERMQNDNEEFKDELGRTKRSSHQENKTPTGMLGSYVVKSPKYADSFKVSCGSLSHEEAAAAWKLRETDFDQIIRFKYFAHGTKDAPRHALFDGFRSPEDMS